MPNPAAKIRAEHPGLAVRSKQRNGVTFAHPDFPDDPRAGVWVGVPGPIHDEAGNDLDSGWVADTQGFEWRSVNLDAGTVLRARSDVTANPWQVERLGQSILFHPQGLYWTNDLDQLQPIAASPSGTTTPDTLDRLIWQDCFGAGLDLEMVGHISGRVEKRLHVDALASLPAPALSGTVWLDLWVGFTASNGLTPYVDGQVFSPRNNTITVVSQIEWRTASGETMGYFRAPIAIDAEGNQLPATMLIRRQGPSLSARIRVPWSALQTAVYPIVIDPTYEVAAGGDDGYGEGFVGGTRTFTDNATFLALGSRSGSVNGLLGWARYANVTIPAGATVTDAQWNVYGYGSFSVTSTVEARFRVHMEAKADASASPTTTGEHDTIYNSGAGLTTYAATIDVVTANIPSGATDYDVTAAAQAIIQDETYGAWASGNDLMVCPYGWSVTAQAYFEVASYEHATHPPPSLSITYTAGTNYTETGLSAGVAFATGGTETLSMSESLAAGVAFATGGTGDTLAMVDALSAGVALATSSTDTLAMTESLSAGVVFSVGGTDALSFLEHLTAGVAFSTLSADTQAMVEQALSAGVLFTTGGSDIFSGGGTAYDETGYLSAGVAFNVSGTDAMTMVEQALAAGVAFSVGGADALSMAEPALSAGVTFSVGGTESLTMLDSLTAGVALSTGGVDVQAMVEQALSAGVVFLVSGTDTYTPEGTPEADVWVILSERGADQRLYHTDVKDNSPRQRERYGGVLSEIPAAAPVETTTSNYEVAINTDDACIYSVASYTGTPLYVGWYVGYTMTSLAYFSGDSIAAGKTVSSATLSVFDYGGVSRGAPTEAHVHMDKAQDSSPPTNFGDVSGRTLTTAFTDFAFPTTKADAYIDIDVTAAVQEIVDLGYLSNGSCAAVLVGQNSNGGSNTYAVMRSQESTPSSPMLLEIVWS